jgi:hypothetical protein
LSDSHSMVTGERLTLPNRCLDGRHHQVTKVVAGDAARRGKEAHGFPITAVQRESDPNPLAVVAADLQALSTSGDRVHRPQCNRHGVARHRRYGDRAAGRGPSSPRRPAFPGNGWRCPVFASVVRPRPGSCTVVPLPISRKLPLLMVEGFGRQPGHARSLRERPLQ